MSLQKSTMTMEQLLEQLITKVFCNNYYNYNYYSYVMKPTIYGKYFYEMQI